MIINLPMRIECTHEYIVTHMYAVPVWSELIRTRFVVYAFVCGPPCEDNISTHSSVKLNPVD